MSIKRQAEVWRHSNEKGSALLLLLAIADFADDEGVAFPSVKTLSQKIRMSQRNTRYRLKRLEKSGELTIQTGAGPRGCNLFRLAKIAGQSLQEGCKPASLPPAIAIAPEPSIEPSKKREPVVLVEIWNEKRGNLTECKKLTKERKRNCETRARGKGSEFLTEFEEAVRLVASSPFCCGDNDRGWRVDFDWMIANDTNMQKVLEGKYNPRQSQSARPAELVL